MRLYKKRTSDENVPVSTVEAGQTVMLYQHFETIFRDTKDRLHHFTIKLTHNGPETKDLIQEVYARLWENLPTIDTTEDVLPLLLTYARNCFIDLLRKKERDSLFVAQLSEKLPTIEPATAQDSLEVKDKMEQLRQSLEQLPPKRREIFTLVKEKGLSHKEVAAQLGIATATVEKQIGLSLQFLRKELNS